MPFLEVLDWSFPFLLINIGRTQFLKTFRPPLITNSIQLLINTRLSIAKKTGFNACEIQLF